MLHPPPIDFAVPDEGDGLSFDELAEPVGLAGAEGERAMDDHQGNAGADRGEKRRGAVDGAGEHRTDQDDEDRIEGGFFRERTAVADPDEGESDDEDDETAERGLQQGELGRFAVLAEKHEERILERVHKKVSPEHGGARVSMCSLRAINPSLPADTFSQ